jgi:hypothetical protein
MNERINRLIEQAGLEYNFDPMAWLKYEKLVELAVLECSDICINENVSNIDLKVMRESGKFTVQDLATKSCGENLAKRIKERFGL